MGITKTTLGVLALGSLTALSGCEQLFGALGEDSSTVVNVFATHHATPTDGVVPDRGGDGEVRVFDNDEGWTVHLTEGFVTIQGVTLDRCDGMEMPVDLYFGSVPENLKRADLDLISVGGTEVGAAEFCGMTVHYGPYNAGADASPEGIEAETIDGKTVHLKGYSERGDEQIQFEVDVAEGLDVHIDLSQPLRVTGDEAFPLELTLAKTYDRFFDGIDFEDVDELDLEAHVTAVLELETRIEAG